MPDREKVIKGLRQCVGYEDVDNKYTCIYDGDTNPNCPYGRTGGDEVSCMTKMMRDALTLLKAQEPIEPTKPDEDNMVYCGACGTPVGYEVLEPHGMDYIRYNYCPNCGRNVRWE